VLLLGLVLVLMPEEAVEGSVALVVPGAVALAAAVPVDCC
jgi:hypothetical protein